eukprot:s1624_g6.t1
MLRWILCFVLGAALDEQWNQFGSSTDGRFVVAISMRNGIYVSQDYGHTWMQRGQIELCMWPCRHGAVAVSSDGRQMVVVGGSEDRIYRSEDYGSTWTPLTALSTSTFRAAAAGKDGQLIFVGTPSSIWKSSDAGGTWSELAGTSGLSWWGLTTSADGSKVAGYTRENYHCTCCGCGAIWVSLDSGESWTQPSADGSFWDITATGDFTRLWVATRRSLETASVWLSSDSGNRWTERLVSSSHAASELGIAASRDGGTLAIVFEELGYYPGWLYLSFDYGLTWAPSSFDGSNGCTHVAVSEDGLWMVSGGVFGPPFVSFDAGASWTPGQLGSSTTTVTDTTATKTTTEPFPVNNSNTTQTTTTVTTTFRSTSYSTTTDGTSTSSRVTTTTSTAEDEADIASGNFPSQYALVLSMLLGPFSLSQADV